MKRNVLHTLVLICSFGLFAACSDDDPVDESWKNLTATFQGDNLILSLNHMVLQPGELHTVDFVADMPESGVITLNNILPEQPNLEIPVIIKKQSGFEWEFFDASTETKATWPFYWELRGKLDKAKDKITVEIYRKRYGYYKELYEASKNPYNVQNIYLEVNFGDTPIAKQGAAVVSAMLNQKMAGALESMTFRFQETGFLDLRWKMLNRDYESDYSQFMPDITPMQFFVENDLLYIAIDKGILADTSIAAMLPLLLQQYGATREQFMSLFVDLGGYLGIPFKITLEANKLKLTTANGLFAKMIQAGGGKIVRGMMDFTEEQEARLALLLAEIQQTQTAEISLVISQ